MKELETFTKDFDRLWAKTQTTMLSNNTLDNIERHLLNNQQSIGSNQYTTLNKKFGIYIFYIKPKQTYNYKSLCEDWRQSNYDRYPKVIKKTFNQYQDIDTEKWYPLYIGKCQNLGKRLLEHITHRDKKSTYSLKLNGRAQFSSDNVTYSFWELPHTVMTDSKEIKQFILTQLEYQLRRKINPWIGKQ